jgi:hypothetical protein
MTCRFFHVAAKDITAYAVTFNAAIREFQPPSKAFGLVGGDSQEKFRAILHSGHVRYWRKADIHSAG